MKFGLTLFVVSAACLTCGGKDVPTQPSAAATEKSVLTQRAFPASDCAVRVQAIRDAWQEAIVCEHDSDCVIRNTQICYPGFMGCYWTAHNQTRSTTALDEAIRSYSQSECRQADCDCTGLPTQADCVEGMCQARAE